jgi:hypothetical protein
MSSLAARKGFGIKTKVAISANFLPTPKKKKMSKFGAKTSAPTTKAPMEKDQL